MFNGQMVQALWKYRHFVLGSVRREFEARYKGSLLGAFWAVLHPLALIVVYTLIFSQVMQAKLPGVDTTFAYSIYLCAGMFTWALFAEIVGRAQSMFLDNGNLLKKSAFPRICLPAILVASSLLNFAIVLALFLVFLLISGNFPGWSLLAVFPVLLVQLALAIGLGVLLGTLNVFFRDIGQMMGVLLQFWFWLTPIVYPHTILPESARPWLELNPMYPLITAYQGIFVSQTVPAWYTMLYPTALALVLLLLGLRAFRASAGQIVDEL